MSKTGDPSTMSAPPSMMLRPLTSTTCATLRPGKQHTSLLSTCCQDLLSSKSTFGHVHWHCVPFCALTAMPPLGKTWFLQHCRQAHRSCISVYGCKHDIALCTACHACIWPPSPVPSLMEHSPMGQGRCGERVASTPTRWPFRRGTCTLALRPSAAWSEDHRRCRSVLQWKMYITQTWEYCSSPSRQPAGMSGLQRPHCCTIRAEMSLSSSKQDLLMWVTMLAGYPNAVTREPATPSLEAGANVMVQGVAACLSTSLARAAGTSRGCRGVPFRWLKQDCR